MFYSLFNTNLWNLVSSLSKHLSLDKPHSKCLTLPCGFLTNNLDSGALSSCYSKCVQVAQIHWHHLTACNKYRISSPLPGLVRICISTTSLSDLMLEFKKWCSQPFPSPLHHTILLTSNLKCHHLLPGICHSLDANNHSLSPCSGSDSASPKRCWSSNFQYLWTEPCLEIGSL